MSLNWVHVAIWVVIWLAAYKAMAAGIHAYLDRPGKGRHSR